MDYRAVASCEPSGARSLGSWTPPAKHTCQSFLPSWKLAEDRWEQHREGQTLLETFPDSSMCAGAFRGPQRGQWFHPPWGHLSMRRQAGHDA